MLDIPCEVVLAQILKLSEEELRTAFALTRDYKIVRVPKKSTGYRILYIPPEPLKKVQRKILKYLFQKLWRTRQVVVYGISRGTSYVEHAKQHKEAKWVFQFDLKDAFPSVNVLSLTTILLKRLLEEIKGLEGLISGYRNTLKDLEEAKRKGDKWYIKECSESVERYKREILSSVFAKTSLEKLIMAYGALPQKEEIAQQLADLIIKLTTFQGVLPQGTPTAPFLFYLALTEEGLLDELKSLFPIILPESQDRYRFQVSVYVDNFVISAQKPIPLEKQKELFRMVERFGFRVNSQKIRHQGVKDISPLITGLRVTNNKGERKIVLPKRKIRKWRGLIHRAIFEPDLRPKVNGFISSLKPIYGNVLPRQLNKPYQKLLQAIAKEEKEGKE